MDYINIGSTPAAEDCAQVGSSTYPAESRRESERFIRGILHHFGMPPEGARVASRTFPHDFGSYREVVVYFVEDKPDAVDYALRVESECPETWEELEKGL